MSDNTEKLSGLNLNNQFDDEAKKITSLNIISKRIVESREISLFKILKDRYHNKKDLLDDLKTLEFHLENKFLISWITFQNTLITSYHYNYHHDYNWYFVENLKIELKDNKLYFNLNNNEGSNE